MNIDDLTRALKGAMVINASNAVSAIDQYDTEFEAVQDRLVSLVRKHAGIVPAQPGDGPAQRLNSLRLTTQYPGVRKQALRALILESQTAIQTLVPLLVSALMKHEFATIELRMEEERSREVKVAQREHRVEGLYADVATAADRLHAGHGVTYHHWKALSDRQIEVIAAVLQGEGE